QAALPAGAVLVDLLEYTAITPPAGRGPPRKERRLAAFAVRAGREVAFVDLGPVAPVATAVNQWLGAMTAEAASVPAAAGTELRRLLWQPLLPHVAGARAVLIAPDGVLARFPFAALPGSQPGSYLLEEVPIAVLPAPALLAPPSAASSGSASLLLL